MNKQFLDLLQANPNENVMLVTNSTPPKCSFLQFDNNGDPLSLQYQRKKYNFLCFDNLNVESNPRALFFRQDSVDCVRRIEINFYGILPPFFTLVERGNLDMMPTGGIKDYCGEWIVETQCNVKRI